MLHLIMSDSEPISSKDISFNPSISTETKQNNVSPTLIEIRHQLDQEDLLWIKRQQEKFVQQIRDTSPQLEPPTRMNFSERSLYGMAYEGFTTTATVSEWELGGGHSLEKLGFLKIIGSNGHVIDYESDKKNPQDWDNARKICLNDPFFKRHQELGDAFKAINPIKADKYPLDFYLDPNRPEDKSIINIYQQYKLEFQETEFGWQPILDLSKPPGNEFLYTNTAINFFNSLEKNNLHLSDSLISELINRKEQRYGNSYVTLSREIAKLVSSSDRPLSTFFSTDIKDENQLFSKINSLEIPEDPAAALLINTIKQIVQRQSTSDLPVSNSETSFKAGTCKDLESYFSASVNEDTSYIVEVNHKRYLQQGSHHQSVKPMMINLEPIVFNGVLFPPGNLFRNSDNQDGYHYMRATAFYFKQDYAQQVFGEEYRESIDSWGPPTKTFNLISSNK